MLIYLDNFIARVHVDTRIRLPLLNNAQSNLQSLSWRTGDLVSKKTFKKSIVKYGSSNLDPAPKELPTTLTAF